MTQRTAARPPSRLSTGGSQHGLFGGLRVSELAGLTWSDIVARNKGQVQLSVLGKGGIVRQVLLPEAVSRALLSLRGDAGANDAVLDSRKTDARLTERGARDRQARGRSRWHRRACTEANEA